MTHFLQPALIVLGAAVVVLLVSHRLRLPAVVGLLLTGLLIGPSGLGLLRVEAVEVFAEIGVLFLLFAIGLEFSLDRLREIRRPFFLGGPLQAVTAIVATALIAMALGAPPLRAVFFGFLVALSSTAVVLKLYSERRVLESPQGRLVLGVLLFQDFLIVPMIVLTPVLAGTVVASPREITLRFGGGVLAVSVVFLVARYLMPRLLYYLVRTRIRELFVLGALLVCVGSAFLTASLGFSLALGAFLAGIVVAESEYSNQVVAEVAPFRDVFTSVFFISIGMLVDLDFASQHLPQVLGFTLGVIALKALTGAAAAWALRLTARIVALVALALAQMGEFSFVLLNVGRAQGLIGVSEYQTAIAVAVLTLLLTPLLVAVSPWVGERLPSWMGAGGAAGAAAAGGQGGVAGPALERHVVIVGFGLNGRTLARVLREAGIRYVVIELNGDVVEEARAAGEPILFGDSTRREILEHAGIERAQVVVFAISDLLAVHRSIALARQLNRDVHILVRTRAMAHIEELRRHGADDVLAEEFEAAIEIFTRVLERYHVPRNVIRAQTRVLRGEGYRMLRTPRMSGEVSDALLQALALGTTDLFLLAAGSPGVGATLRELDLRHRTGATVIAVVRDGKPSPNPPPELRLAVGDTLVLVGSHQEIESAYGLLEPATEGDPAEAGGAAP
jgi:CPA2 family monovalent cation:H+ antiporter-2